MKPLEGLVVADFSRVVAGPLVAMTLGDLGARVIKVERRGVGDDTRAWGPPWRERPTPADAAPGTPPERVSTYFLGVNRNKESVQIEFGDPEDRAVAHRLSEVADVLVENFRTGTLDRFGLGWDQCRARNPRLVYCSIEGFGDTPPAADLAGYDLLAQAASGLMSITGEDGGRPLKTGVAVVDVLAALNATIGVLAALEARHSTGRGRRVQVSLMDSALSALINQASAHLVAGVTPTRSGNDHPSIAPYSTYPASDREFVVACGTDAQFAALAAVVGRPGLADDTRFATNEQRVHNRAALDDVLIAQFAGADAAAWIDRLRAVGVPSGPINTIAEGIALAESLGLDPVASTVDPDGSEVPTIRSPIRFGDPDGGGPGGTGTAPPHLGQHDATVRAWLGSSS